MNIFDDPVYQESRINRVEAFLPYLRIIPDNILPPRNSWVFETGCGDGQLGELVASMTGWRMFSVDGRPEHIDRLRERFSYRRETSKVMDLEVDQSSDWGIADNSYAAVLCWGTLYHLARPYSFLRKISRLAPVIFLETVVVDSFEPVCYPSGEAGADQAVSGAGSRFSDAWLRMALRSLGREVTDISSGRANWKTASFDWQPRYDGRWIRGEQTLRKMYICVRQHGGR